MSLRAKLGRLRTSVMMRYPALRTAQWFYKSEPKAFTRLPAPGPDCPACGVPASHDSDYPSWARPFARHRVLYCAACGLGFVRGMGPVLEAYYKNEYGKTNRGDRQTPPADYFREVVAGADPALDKYAGRVKRQIRLLKKHDARFDQVLDYGSGPGYFLHACKAKAAHAIEPDALSHKYLAHLGAQIHRDVDALPRRSFDVIVASHAIEHLPAEDLQSTLSALIGALKPEGRLLIEVPQGGHSYLHLAGHRQDPHTLFFTARALSVAVQNAGAKILYWKAQGHVSAPRRADPIFTPEGSEFVKTDRGSLTMICIPRPPKKKA